VARKRAIDKILVSGNTLSLKECAFLIDLYDRDSGLTRCRDYNSRPLLDYYTLRDVDSESANWVYRVTVRCKENIETHFSTPELFVESFFVASIISGDSHIPHADNERREDRRWVPNHTPQRDYTALVYLNDDFTGGELVFPALDVLITPQPGLSLYTQSRRFAPESDTLFRSDLRWTRQKLCRFELFQEQWQKRAS
jgi:hypothetical protein